MGTRQPWRASLQAPAQGSASRWPWAQNHHRDWHLVGCLEQERAWKSPSLAALPSEAYWEHRLGKMPGHCQAEWSCPLKSRLLQPPGASSCCLSEPEWILSECADFLWYRASPQVPFKAASRDDTKTRLQRVLSSL